MKYPNLRANVGWAAVGKFADALSRWALLAIIAQLGSAALVGRYALALAIVTPVFVLLNLSLRNIHGVDTEERFTIRDVLGLRTTLIPIGLLTTLLIVWLGPYGSEILQVVLLVAIGKAVESQRDALFAAAQQKRRMDHIGRSQVLTGTLAAVSCVIGMATGGLIAALGLFALSQVVVMGLYDIPRTRQLLIRSPTEEASNRPLLRPNFETRTLRRLLALSLPMGVGSFIWSLSANIPRLAIERYLGESALGYFVAAIYIMMLGNKVVSAIGEPISVRLAAWYASGKEGVFKRGAIVLVAISLTMAFGGMLVSWALGGWILGLAYGPDYVRYDWLLVLAFGVGVTWYLSEALKFIALSVGHLKLPLYAYLSGTVTGSAIAFALIPVMGLSGGALALSVSSAIISAVLGGGVLWRVKPMARRGSGTRIGHWSL